MKDKKHTTRFLVITILISVTTTLFWTGVIYAYFSQWNIHGVAKMPNIEIAHQEGAPDIQYVEDCKETPVYSYGIKSMYYMTITANEISVKDYLKYKWVDVNDLIQGGYGATEMVDDIIVYVFQGYYVIPTKKAIIICAGDREPAEAIQKLNAL